MVEEEVPELVVDPSTGELVEKPRYGGTINVRLTGDINVWDQYAHLEDVGPYSVWEGLMRPNWATPRDQFDFSLDSTPLKYTMGRAMESYELSDPLAWTSSSASSGLWR